MHFLCLDPGLFFLMSLQRKFQGQFFAKTPGQVIKTQFSAMSGPQGLQGLLELTGIFYQTDIAFWNFCVREPSGPPRISNFTGMFYQADIAFLLIDICVNLM